MMPLRILIVGFLLLSGPLRAQSSDEIPQMEDSLATLTQPFDRIDLMTDLAYAYRNDDLAAGLEWAYQAEQLARRQQYPKGLGDSYLRQALLYFKMGSLEKAMEKALLSIEYRKQLGNDTGVGSVYLMLANIQTEQEQWKGALESYQAAEKHFQQADNQGQLTNLYNDRGIFHSRRDQYALARADFWQGVALLQQFPEPDTVMLSRFYRNIGSDFFTLANLDSAQHYFQLSETLLRQYDWGETYDEAATQFSLGLVTVEKGKQQAALDQYFRPAYQTAVVQELGTLLPQILEEKVRAFEGLGKFDSALVYAQELRAIEYEQLTPEYRDRSDFLNQMFSKQERVEQELETEQLRVFIAVLAILALGVVIGLLIWLSRLREKRITASMLGQIQQKDLRFLSQLMEGMERERQRIAHDLHDNLLTLLGISSLNLNALEDTIAHLKDEPATRNYQLVQKNLQQAIDKTRSLSHEMEKGILRELGLEGALAQLKDALEATGRYVVSVDCLDTDTVKGANVELITYQFMRELVNNIVRHAEASEINLYVMVADQALSVIVEDNGKGFPKNWQPKAGIGLAHIQAQVEELGGSFTIDSQGQNGATIRFDLPLAAHESS